MGKRIVAMCLVVAMGGAAASAGGGESGSPAGPMENLSLEKALAMAERLHPQLAEATARVEAAEGRARQAGAFPNPEIVAGAQQLPFEKESSNQREFSAGIAQPIPVGGRLGKAREAELLEREVHARGLDVTRRELRKGVQVAFAAALFQEWAVQLQGEIALNAEALVATARARVEAGDAVPGDFARAEMELTRARVEVQRGRSLREQAVIALAAAIGDARLKVGSLAGSLEAPSDIPALESLAASVSSHPEMLQASAGLSASRARIDLARAERIPDVRVEALYHRLDGAREDTFDVGLSVPLPLFDRNQGRVREARAEAAAAEARARMAENDLNLRLRESHARLTAAMDNARAFQAELLPRADAVLKAAESRYAAGDESLTHVLLMRREWAEIRLGHLAALRDVMQARAELSGYLKSP